VGSFADYGLLMSRVMRKGPRLVCACLS
jgi:hypothetical protein